jgi:hypothetical protein
VRTSIASLAPTASAGQLAALYDDSYRGTGELQRSAELARVFPDFDALLAAGLLDVAQQLYGDMLNHVQLVNGQHPQALARFAEGDAGDAGDGEGPQ